ncbi:MAG TPA: DUF4097 family beta strand repeat-containing protein [Bryobacteraceae bacterium]|nr:DUF4097 family beta strand repeat-containing protein [Bryobacteraceae bacterium]
MRRKSMTGPLLLLIVGGLLLLNNLHPEAPLFDMFARYWPFVLIAWGLLRLVEVLSWRDRGYSSFSGGEVWLIILICVIGSGLYQAHEHGIRFNGRGLDMFGEQYDYPISAHSASGQVDRITFENPHGNIKVVGGDSSEVTVNGHKVLRAWARGDADRTNEKTPVEIIPQGDRLLIRTNQEGVPDNQRISDDLEVTVPRGVTVEARGHNGDFEVTDITGDVELASDHADVRISRIGGNARIDVGKSDLIRASDIKGKIDIQGRGSDLELENVGGQVTINGGYMGNVEFKNLAKPLQVEGARNTELHVQAVPGRITMDLGQFSGNDIIGPIRLVTGSRDIKLEKFTQSLQLETQRGDVELTPGTLPLPSIDARSGVGRIDLILPPKATFDLDATVQRGEVIDDFGLPVEKETKGRAASLKAHVGDGPNLHITANRGSISVRKEGAEPSEIPPPPDPSSDHFQKPPQPPQPPKQPKSKVSVIL